MLPPPAPAVAHAAPRLFEQNTQKAWSLPSSPPFQFDPRRRISVEEALAHPWLAQLHDEAAEPSAPGAELLLLSCCCSCFHCCCCRCCLPCSGGGARSCRLMVWPARSCCG